MPRLSVQLYSVREELADLDGTLARLAALGVDTVEPFSVYDRTLELPAALARHGMTAPTGHGPFLSDEIEYEGRMVPLPPLEVTLDAARHIGVEVLIDPVVPAQRWQTADDVARTADRLNAAADRAAERGMRVGHHNHTFEFSRRFGDRTAYEHFVALLDPRVVLELDVFWAATAGEDVPALLHRLGDRVHALHLKDGAVGPDPFAAGTAYDPEALDLRPLGDGELDLAGILAAAPAVAFDVLEFDSVDGDVFAALEASIGYLGSHDRRTA
ncbi:sugar phosphate isomerase/epimerase [Blastococcus sp. URHD0036]|uniref:sugar phosphate isomerase/epimerase family protein n=1 Tax=Blastococcus sp. URHD0036 TaxID=1380356 RepID=UPI00049703FE|nr:sugar phosphate isomerase/epimerase [Blastococcus sp. URHD0036]